MTRQIRVLVADDSALMRRLISDLLASAPDIKVVGTARDGLEVLRLVETLHPDVITLDVDMPRLSGLEALSRIMQQHPTPVIILTGLKAPEVAVEAIQRGAVDMVLKPSGLISVDIYKVREELITKVRAAAEARMRPITGQAGLSTPPSPSPPSLSLSRMVVVAASTGGPQALSTLLSALPADLPAAFLVVQHMPARFTTSLAQRLNSYCPLLVKEAEHGEAVEPGRVYVAPGGYHTRVRKSSSGVVLTLDQAPPIGRLRPAANVTMRTVAAVYGASSVGVVLTGMGSDGAEGLRWIKEQGGVTIAQDKDTSVIYGMPRVAYESGYVDLVLSLPEIASVLVHLIRTGHLPR